MNKGIDGGRIIIYDKRTIYSAGNRAIPVNNNQLEEISMFEGLHHVALAVTDLERAKRFYSVVLGLEESDERPAFPFPGAWYRIGSEQLHLIVHDGSKTGRGTQAIDSKDGHFAFRVTDANAVKKKLETHGWSFDDRPNSITGWHQLFTTDPDGNVIEFNSKR
jgi:glyoxylase I family protein